MRYSILFATCFVFTCLAETFTLSPSADTKKCRATELNALIRQAKSGDIIQFQKGHYQFNQIIAVVEKKGLTLRGEKGTVLCARFKADGLMTSAIVLWAVNDSEDICLEQFACTTENPPSVTARVAAVNPQEGTYDVRFEADSNFQGTEPLCIADSCDESGAPDGVLSWHHMNPIEEDDGKGGKRTRNRGIPYTMVAPNVARVSMYKGYDFSKLKVGSRMVYRLLIGGSTLNINNSKRVTVRDVEVWRCPSITCVIAPCSEDVTFERFAIRPTPGSGALYSSNADGIHVAGMSGTLTLKDCHFEGMGDDPLNVHGKSSELHEYDPETGKAKCVWRLFHKEPQKMGKRWALAGDTLAIFNRKTFLLKGTTRVKETAGFGEMTLEKSPLLALGDILINTRDCPKVRISGCSVKNIRSRGFLLQTHDVEVKDCTFEGIGGAGIMAAPDINNWYESGPTDGLTVENCRFTSCGRRGGAASLLVKVNHEGPIDAFPAGVHRNIAVSNCTFRDCKTKAICIASTEGVSVKNCSVTNCADPKPIDFVNCANITFVK